MEKILKKKILEQKLEIDRLLGATMLSRAPMEKIDVNGSLAQAVLGMRRSGKSVICRMALAKAGVSFGYVDFDDEVLANLKSEHLDSVLDAVKEVYGEVSHFFFDEIQNIEGWHLFVNRLLRAGNHIVITGSNARLLNSELSTHLTGRHIPISVMPFSYLEYSQWMKSDTQETWKNYFYNGGLPETFALTDKRNYVTTLYNSILTKDILGRHKVRNAQRFVDAAYVIMKQFAREIAYDALADKAGVSSPHTMQTYLGYLEESYLVSRVRKYSFKPAERIRNDKLYVTDPAFISYFTGVMGSEEELGWRLENIVYLELLRRRQDGDYEIYYYKDQSYDVDFVLVRHDKIVGIVQVAYTIEGEKTRKRELDSLFGLGKKLHCDNLLLITDKESDAIFRDRLTAQVVPAREFCVGALTI